VKSVGTDPSAFTQKYDPSSPAADAAGYVRTPNVNGFVEMMDMREAERSYSANLNVMQASRNMLARVIDLLK
jgi:flagellar basal-body rod protein FlgC